VTYEVHGAFSSSDPHNNWKVADVMKIEGRTAENVQVLMSTCTISTNAGLRFDVGSFIEHAWVFAIA
jgi:hypothetical protein